MKKRLISLIVAVVMLFSMLCPAAYADDETVSFDTCTHEWETPLRSGYSITIPGSDVSFSVKTEQCKKCKWYKHVATIFIAEFTYYSPLNVDANGLVPTELATYWANVWYNNFGKNATATKFAAGGGSTSGGGVGRPKGYADDNGTSSVNNEGNLTFVAKYCFTNDSYHFVDSFSITDTDKDANKIWHFGSSSIQVESYSKNVSDIYAYGGYVLDTQNISGIFYIPKGTTFVYNPWGEYNYHDIGFGWNSFETDSIWSHSCDGSKQYLILYRYNNQTKMPDYTYSNENGTDILFYQDSHLRCRYVDGVSSGYPDDLIVYCRPTSVTVNKQTTITINNNTWNGNIYTDNSTNLTYIYPQYTTVNEKNETVTNISTTPIIYNNETKQYYTYDQTTKNYYYITYNTQPTPSPSPTPAPTEKPGGSISTPETGKPGGDTGDTTGILAVLVEIRDNMIQGFLDIKAAFVAGFADISANFQLAIDNLNINIQNFFNKKMEDLPEPTPTPSPTPEPSNPTPSPSPSPAPTDPPSPTPTPTGKPDSGDKTNNFWTIIFPNGGGTEDGKKGIFWALVSLILALIAFFANLAVGVGYLFPFLPDGVVMTINTCLIVIFLFTIIKFIMRSK